MKKQTSVQVSLINPCTQDTDGMLPVEGGRFCAQCQTTVTDFTRMSDADLVAWLRHHPAGCGTFRPDQLSHNLLTSPPVKKRLPLAVRWGLGFLLFLGWIKGSNAQQQAGKKEATHQVPASRRTGGALDTTAQYPWQSTRSYLRNRYQGEFTANKTGGYSDRMGMSGGLNDSLPAATQPDTLR